jgi:polysaccharide pyruvyl transferase WcaK-like protein
MRILLIGMFGLYNRGCEAIVWGSAEILRQIYPGAHIAVAVGDESSASIDRGRLPDLEVEILPFIRRPTLAQRAFWRMMRLVQHKAVTRNWGFPFKGWDLILEVGGDTFAIPGFEWRFVGIAEFHKK